MSTPREVLIRQWFHVALTEKQGQALVGHISGAKKYGLLVPYNDLPEQAKALVRAEYDAMHNALESPCADCGRSPQECVCVGLWERRVRALESEGLTRSDAQAVVDAEDDKNICGTFDLTTRERVKP